MAAAGQVLFQQNFSFDPRQRSHHTMPSISPYTPSPSGVSRTDLSLLAQQFGQQSMHYSAQSASSSTSSHAYACGHTADQVRYQRQVYAQQLASISETKVVASPTQICEMCVQAQQYALYMQQQRVARGEEDEDEGFDEPESSPELDAALFAQNVAYRRSTDFTASGVRVHRAVRGRRRRAE